MELLVELVAWVGQLLLELLLQLLFEILAEIGLKSVREAMRPSKPARPLWGLFGYILLGAVLGGVSVLLFPHKFAVPAWLQIANIAAAPVVMGIAMVGVGRWRARRNQQTILLHKFWFGFVFALIFALVRFRFAA
jgi:hypothetical protein